MARSTRTGFGSDAFREVLAARGKAALAHALRKVDWLNFLRRDDAVGESAQLIASMTPNQREWFTALLAGGGVALVTMLTDNPTLRQAAELLAAAFSEVTENINEQLADGTIPHNAPRAIKVAAETELEARFPPIREALESADQPAAADAAVPPPQGLSLTQGASAALSLLREIMNIERLHDPAVLRRLRETELLLTKLRHAPRAQAELDAVHERLSDSENVLDNARWAILWFQNPDNRLAIEGEEPEFQEAVGYLRRAAIEFNAFVDLLRAEVDDRVSWVRLAVASQLDHWDDQSTREGRQRTRQLVLAAGASLAIAGIMVLAVGLVFGWGFITWTYNLAFSILDQFGLFLMDHGLTERLWIFHKWAAVVAVHAVIIGGLINAVINLFNPVDGSGLGAIIPAFLNWALGREGKDQPASPPARSNVGTNAAWVALAAAVLLLVVNIMEWVSGDIGFVLMFLLILLDGVVIAAALNWKTGWMWTAAQRVAQMELLGKWGFWYLGSGFAFLTAVVLAAAILAPSLSQEVVGFFRDSTSRAIHASADKIGVVIPETAGTRDECVRSMQELRSQLAADTDLSVWSLCQGQPDFFCGCPELAVVERQVRDDRRVQCAAGFAEVDKFIKQGLWTDRQAYCHEVGDEFPCNCQNPLFTAGPSQLTDADHDLIAFELSDCDDADAQANPRLSEFHDGKDNDCDNQVDEDFTYSGPLPATITSPSPNLNGLWCLVPLLVASALTAVIVALQRGYVRVVLMTMVILTMVAAIGVVMGAVLMIFQTAP